MNNDTELVEFYKFLSERAIIEDCCRGEGEAECAVKLYNKSKVKKLNIGSVVCSDLPEDEQDPPYCTDCGNEDLEYIDQYANGDFWRCKECKKEFIH